MYYHAWLFFPDLFLCQEFFPSFCLVTFASQNLFPFEMGSNSLLMTSSVSQADDDLLSLSHQIEDGLVVPCSWERWEGGRDAEKMLNEHRRNN
jgi:hypothetical protein